MNALYKLVQGTKYDELRTDYISLIKYNQRAANFTINPTDEELRTEYSKILTEHLSAK